MSDLQLIVETKDRVLFVTLNRPQKRNALSSSLLRDIREAFAGNAADESLIAAVISGAGEHCFAAGGDLREFDTLRSVDEGRAMAIHARSALDSIRRFPVPVIAALNGDALGGGAELSASCDFRVAAAHARIGFIQGRLSISSAWGGGIDLFGIVGRRKALRLLTTARILDAEDALRAGLFDEVCRGAQTLDEAVQEFIEPMRQLPPQVHRAFKALSIAMTDRTIAEGVELENFATCWGHADHWASHDAILSKQGQRP